GIARMGGSGTLTEAGTVLGTASYISPEQAAGETATPASDVYSFGVILWRMLTGRLPFSSTSAMELVRMHRDEEPPPLSVFRTDAPARRESLALATLAKDPADRPPDGRALLVELITPGERTTILAPAAAPPPPGRRGSRLPLVLVGLAALLLAGAAVAVI